MYSTEIKIQTPSGIFDIDSNRWIETFIDTIEKPVKKLIGVKEMSYIANIVREDIMYERIGGRSVLNSSYPEYVNPEQTRKRKGHLIPLIDSFDLFNSIEAQAKEFEASVLTNLDYAVYLEYGTSKMKPRYFFGISEQASKKIDTYLNSLMKTKIN